MAKEFDPYYKWLGIPPKDQPPNHYRLLGIEVFESDRDVIDAAANRVMAYLKDLATGDEIQYSQQLLNEVSRARISLLNKQQKVDYDKQLRATFGETQAKEARKPAVRRPKRENGEARAPTAKPPTPQQQPPVAKQAAPLPNVSAGPSPIPRPKPAPAVASIVGDTETASAANAASPKRPNALAIILGSVGAAAVLGIAVLLYLLIGGGGERQVSAGDPDTTANETIDPGSDASVTDTDPESDPALPESEPPTDPESDPVIVPPPESPNGTPSTEPPVGPIDIPGIPPDSDPARDPSMTEDVPSDDAPGPFDLPDNTNLDPSAMPGAGLPADVDGSSTGDNPSDSVDPATPPDNPFADPVGVGPTGVPVPDDSASTKPPTKEPFAELPQVTALPDAESPSVTVPVSLGKVNLTPGELCFMKLRGGDDACKGNHVFGMRNADGGLAERDWDISLREGEAGVEQPVAHLAIDDEGELTFAWKADLAANPLAAQLSNCALSLSHSGQSHILCLRAPTVVPPLEVDLKKNESEQSWKIDVPPDGNVVFVEFSGMGDVTYVVNPPTAIGASKGEAEIKIQDGGDLLNLKVNADLRRSFELTIRPQVKVAADALPGPFIAAKLSQVLHSKAFGIQQMQTFIANGKQNLGRLSSSERQRAQTQLDFTEQQQLPAAQADLVRWTELSQWITANDGKLQIHFRVYYNADATEVELLRTDANVAP